ncbi:MAG TPA: NAD(P)H-hydrate epimerase, partial [Candidatus Sumerlaeia bacterium]|nr:NAD(P)H-hydrate epimerase [Candidatus Sumerlaeia bacterium]
MKITTAEEMREIDRISIEERGVPSLSLMENAGMAVSQYILHRIAPKHVAVVTGKGNNAGDGFVAARHLYNAGIKVTLLMLSGEKELSGGAERNYSVLSLEIPRYLCTMGSQIAMNLEEADCVVDAILGTGVKGEVNGLYREAIEAINESQTTVVSVDIPSGLPADAEYFDGLCVHADCTITMGLPKIGMMQYPAAGFCGEIIAAPIGHPEDLLNECCESRTHLITMELARETLPYRPADGHKGTFGSVLAVAGSTGMTGAAALCSLSAARSGAGLVFLAIPQSLNPILEIKITEPITIPLPTKEDGIPDTGMLSGILDKSRFVDAIALGPGMGRTAGAQSLIREVYAQSTVPLVLDADGINAFQGAAHLLGERKAPAILTPHPGEMSGLIGIPSGEIQ